MTARCPGCGGRGLIHWHPYWDNGNTPCPRCSGRGTIEENEMTENLKSIQFVFRSSDAPFSFCEAADYIDDQTAALHEHVAKHGFHGYARVGTIALNLDQVAAFWSCVVDEAGKPIPHRDRRGDRHEVSGREQAEAAIDRLRVLEKQRRLTRFIPAQVEDVGGDDEQQIRSACRTIGAWSGHAAQKDR